MDVERCHEFVVLAQTRNFLEASEQLFISQSSLSKHLKSLERELGVTLVNRSTRHVELSAAGRVFLPYARQMARVNYELQAALFDQSENERSVLEIGSIPVMVPYGITELLARFECENASERLSLVEGDADQLRDMLRRGKLELAFVREYVDEEGDAARGFALPADDELGSILYAQDCLVAVLPRGHALARCSTIELAELADEDFLLLPKGSVMHSLILDACGRVGFVPRIRYQGHRAENIIDLVGRGMGVSLLMRKPAAFLSTEDVVLVDVTPTISTQIKLCFRKGGDLSPAAHRFLTYLPLYTQG